MTETENRDTSLGQGPENDCSEAWSDSDLAAPRDHRPKSGQRSNTFVRDELLLKRALGEVLGDVLERQDGSYIPVSSLNERPLNERDAERVDNLVLFCGKCTNTNCVLSELAKRLALERATE